MRRDLLQGIGWAALSCALTPGFAQAQQASSSLRSVASSIGFNIGVTVGGYGRPEAYRPLVEIQTREFNLGEIGLHWQISEPQRGQYAFDAFLNNLAIARTAGMRTFAQSMIWASSLPAWVREGNFSRDELLKIMYDRISSCLERFGDGVDTFGVVNEA